MDELFASSIHTEATEREVWFCASSGEGKELQPRSDQSRDQDERTVREEYPGTSESISPPLERTESWLTLGGSRSPRGRKSVDHGRSGTSTEQSGFSPKAAIVTGTLLRSIGETESVLRARLRELPMIYILIVAMATLWRMVILGNDDALLHYFDATVILILGGVIALLSCKRHIPFVWLNALELGMIGVLAFRTAFFEYRIVLIFSLRHEPLMAQMTVKNFVLLTAVFILTHGLYVPKTWRRAALVAGPLALLPFVILAALCMIHPEVMEWLGEAWKSQGTPRFFLFTFDAMILGIVTVGASFGAYAISQLRRQVAEARELGQYRLRRRIGGGGMGEIYLAEHQLLKRPCALKLIRPSNVANPKALARFEREVRLTSGLSHPNTVEIYDYGRTEDGTYYYVMEYLRGLNLADLVEHHGPLPAGRVVYLLRQICLALREAHAAALIHRDIKPSNIFASRRGGMDDMAKLLDFGLVLPIDRSDVPQLTGEGQILGTPLFMSPEQATGLRKLDARSDIYSLGAVAYYLLTGRPPFDENDGIRLMIAHARDQVEPPSLIRANIPKDLERVVLRCLAKDPSDRFPDAESLELALAACACVSDWDQDRAYQWWRESGLASAI